MNARHLTIEELRRCVEGRIPPVIATSNAAGKPNVVYLSAVHVVDHERIALSNQFMSKTAANLAENPRASMLLIDPITWSEYRAEIVYERTERRGPVFDRLRREVDDIAVQVGQSDVFRLRSADIYRVERIAVLRDLRAWEPADGRDHGRRFMQLGELTRRLSRCGDLDTMVGAAVRGLDELLGYRRSYVMLFDQAGERLFTIASHGFDEQGVGSEVAVGEGAAGLAAERNEPVRLGAVALDVRYATNVTRSFVGPGVDVALPHGDDTRSRLAVPAASRGQVHGVIVVESTDLMAFDEIDENLLAVVASLIAGQAELEVDSGDEPSDRMPADDPAEPPPGSAAGVTHVRYFAADGSVFLDGDYLIRGVAGRILWSLLERHAQTGQVEFTNKEIRLDKRLELPSYRDNLDTRLIMLKRRLEEKGSPMQLERIGRGRIALRVATSLRFELHE